MFIAFAVILAVIWIILKFAVGITAGLLYLLLVFAVISLIVHLFTGRKTA